MSIMSIQKHSRGRPSGGSMIDLVGLIGELRPHVFRCFCGHLVAKWLVLASCRGLMQANVDRINDVFFRNSLHKACSFAITSYNYWLSIAVFCIFAAKAAGYRFDGIFYSTDYYGRRWAT
jgi:hypothetical protein